MRINKISNESNGYIIGIVILFCIVISIITATVTNSVHTSLSSVKVYHDIIRARELAISSVEMIVGKIINSNDNVINGKEHITIGDDTSYVKYIDESSKIDINTSSPELISNLFVKLGANEQSALGYANRIVDWREAGNDQRPQEAKKAAYQEKGRAPPRSGPFSSTLELFYVLDIPQEIIIKAMPWLTTENGTDKINIMIADKLVLMSIPNLSDGAIREIIDARNNNISSIDKIVQSLGKSATFLGKDKGRGIRINIDIKINNSIEKEYEAIVIINTDKKQGRPYNIITWIER